MIPFIHADRFYWKSTLSTHLQMNSEVLFHIWKNTFFFFLWRKPWPHYLRNVSLSFIWTRLERGL